MNHTNHKTRNDINNIMRVTLITGIALLVLGVAGFIPGITTAPFISDPALTVEQSYGRLFGLFPTNLSLNLLRIVLGVWALSAARNVQTSANFCKSISIAYIVFAIMGLIPNLDTMFGTVPLFSHNVWFHIITALPLAYYGFAGVNRTRRVSH